MFFFQFIFVYSHELTKDSMSSLGLKIDFQKGHSILFQMALFQIILFCFSECFSSERKRDVKSHSLASSHTNKCGPYRFYKCHKLSAF